MWVLTQKDRRINLDYYAGYVVNRHENGSGNVVFMPGTGAVVFAYEGDAETAQHIACTLDYALQNGDKFVNVNLFTQLNKEQ